MEYLLHIDTSADTGIIAIGHQGKVLASCINTESRNHAGTINNMINGLLADIKISFKQLSAVAVCAGTGSYTGLRIGLATAKGMCYALDIPLILDNKLTLLAHNACKQHYYYSQYISLLQAREKEYFISIYNNNNICIVPPQHITEDQLDNMIDKNAKTYIVCDVAEKTIDHLMIADLHTDFNVATPIDFWISDAFEKFRCNQFANLMEAEPFYLKQVYTHK